MQVVGPTVVPCKPAFPVNGWFVDQTVCRLDQSPTNRYFTGIILTDAAGYSPTNQCVTNNYTGRRSGEWHHTHLG